MPLLADVDQAGAEAGPRRHAHERQGSVYEPHAEDLPEAEEDDVASRLDDADLAGAAWQIRELDAAAGRKPAA